MRKLTRSQLKQQYNKVEQELIVYRQNRAKTPEADPFYEITDKAPSHWSQEINRLGDPETFNYIGIPNRALNPWSPHIDWSYMQNEHPEQTLAWLIYNRYWDPISGLTRIDDDNCMQVCCSCDRLVTGEVNSPDDDGATYVTIPYNIIVGWSFCKPCALEFEIKNDEIKNDEIKNDEIKNDEINGEM